MTVLSLKQADPFWDLCFGMRPARELYDLAVDPDCVTNLAPTRVADADKLSNQMWSELRAQGDLRALGRGSEYEAHASADRKRLRFYERFMAGELLDADWVNRDDFEASPIP